MGWDYVRLVGLGGNAGGPLPLAPFLGRSLSQGPFLPIFVTSQNHLDRVGVDEIILDGRTQFMLVDVVGEP